ncbi:Hypothetical_protein [Hexamita inflata]|uniref:Hypothetical_protein n=1 Tax=Hexamita inflata TaxID=28002 RepID=A0AA86NUI6_9EUKA|nr:Hypothetical protein HINF_LOCUS12656 [Hexamita inflata]
MRKQSLTSVMKPALNLLVPTQLKAPIYCTIDINQFENQSRTRNKNFNRKYFYLECYYRLLEGEYCIPLIKQLLNILAAQGSLQSEQYLIFAIVILSKLVLKFISVGSINLNTQLIRILVSASLKSKQLLSQAIYQMMCKKVDLIRTKAIYLDLWQLCTLILLIFLVSSLKLDKAVVDQHQLFNHSIILFSKGKWIKIQTISYKLVRLKSIMLKQEMRIDTVPDFSSYHQQ